MNCRRLKKTVFSLCVVLSLFSASIAACVCRDSAAENHGETSHSHATTAKSDSHQTAGQTTSAHHESTGDHHDGAVSTDVFSIGESADDCCCAQSAPKTFAKSETVKIEKQTVGFQSNAPPQIAPVSDVVIIAAIDYAKPFYLSDSFYNLKSPRAPPRL